MTNCVNIVTMWQGNPNTKTTRATSRAPKRKGRSKPLSMSRIQAELKNAKDTTEPVQPIRLVLNDLTPLGIQIFTTTALPTGFEILVSLTHPSRIDLHGKVTSCQQYNLNSKILDMSGQSYRYRARVVFQFADATERDVVRDFCKQLIDQYVRSAQPSEAPEAPAAAVSTEAPATEEAA